jgi:hypothetical protein
MTGRGRRARRAGREMRPETAFSEPKGPEPRGEQPRPGEHGVCARLNLATLARISQCAPRGHDGSSSTRALLLAIDTGSPDPEPASVPIAGQHDCAHTCCPVRAGAGLQPVRLLRHLTVGRKALLAPHQRHRGGACCLARGRATRRRSDGNVTPGMIQDLANARATYQEIASAHMTDRIDALHAAEGRRSAAEQSSDQFREAVAEEKAIANEIWSEADQVNREARRRSEA